MPSDSYLRERRKHDRFVVRKLAIAVPNTPTSQIAKIVNISKGGIAVRYLEQKNWLKNADTIDILVNSNFMMNNIPIKNVNDFKVTNPVSFSIISERQCCLQFGALSPKQELLLNEFIAKYGAGTA